MSERHETTAGSRGVAVVTGGTGSIGRAVLARLRADGFDTASWSRDPAPAFDEFHIAADLTDAEAVARAAAETRTSRGEIRALVIAAGIQGPIAPLWETSPAEFRQVLESNLVSAFLTLHAVVPLMRANSGPMPSAIRGRIVLVSSVQGKEGTALAGAYAASKAGMIAMGKSLGKELAREGILVNAITPTVVRSAMEAALTGERRRDLMARIPIGRVIETEEVAAMVSWLCGPDCTGSTAAVFDLSGGRTTY